MDDSGPSPAITREGALVVGCPTGELLKLTESGWATVGVYGYDILPPAVFDDDSLAVAGYYGAGYCRVRSTGEIVWRTNLMEPDLLPVIASRTQDSAVGSLNAKATRFYRDDGCELGSYPKAALVSEHQLDHWVALSDGEVALLRRNGEPVWVRDVDTQRDWGLRQALVDASGNIFAPQRGGLISFTPEGEQRFVAHIADTVPDVLAFVGDGLVGLVAEARLIIIR